MEKQNHGEGIVEREGRTVVILGEPEGVPCPYGEELFGLRPNVSNIISSMLWGCAELSAMMSSQACVCGTKRYVWGMTW